MKALKIVFLGIGALLAALIVIPLTILAGLFEQDGSFVLRLLATNAAGAIAHTLAEFTRDEILAMIEAAPQQRHAAPETPGA